VIYLKSYLRRGKICDGKKAGYLKLQFIWTEYLAGDEVRDPTLWWGGGKELLNGQGQ